VRRGSRKHLPERGRPKRSTINSAVASAPWRQTRSFSWIISARREHYNIPKYFAFHAMTQAGVAVFLVLVLWVLSPLSRARRHAAVVCLGVAGAIATYGGMLNWMGMPAAYGVSESFNLVAGWLLAFSVIDRLVVGKRSGETAA
jgi:hypothetical protein